MGEDWGESEEWRPARQAAAAVFGVQSEQIEIDLRTPGFVCVNWVHSMTVSVAVHREVCEAVRAVLPERYRSWKVCVV